MSFGTSVVGAGVACAGVACAGVVVLIAFPGGSGRGMVEVDGDFGGKSGFENAAASFPIDSDLGMFIVCRSDVARISDDGDFGKDMRLSAVESGFASLSNDGDFGNTVAVAVCCSDELAFATSTVCFSIIAVRE